MVARYHKLFPEIFETDMFPESGPFEVELIKKGGLGQKNLYRVSCRPMLMTIDDLETIPQLISKGYVPLVTNVHVREFYKKKLDDISAKQLAAILGMASVSLMLPKTSAASPDVILEARRMRLSDQLPPFWSSMLKLTNELKRRITGCRTPNEVFKEAQELIDGTVLPALIDLQSKIEKDRKQFFYRILAPVQKGLRLLVGTPLLTQQQLLTNALIPGVGCCHERGRSYANY